jgi:hypothetical protein
VTTPVPAAATSARSHSARARTGYVRRSPPEIRVGLPAATALLATERPGHARVPVPPTRIALLRTGAHRAAPASCETVNRRPFQRRARAALHRTAIAVTRHAPAAAMCARRRSGPAETAPARRCRAETSAGLHVETALPATAPARSARLLAPRMRTVSRRTRAPRPERASCEAASSAPPPPRARAASARTASVAVRRAPAVAMCAT